MPATQKSLGISVHLKGYAWHKSEMINSQVAINMQKDDFPCCYLLAVSLSVQIVLWLVSFAPPLSPQGRSASCMLEQIQPSPNDLSSADCNYNPGQLSKYHIQFSAINQIDMSIIYIYCQLTKL